MALQAIVTATGRRLFKDASGRFISRQKYELLSRKDPLTGRFLPKATAQRTLSRQKRIEQYLRAQLGNPPSGKNWLQIASKYAERFEDYLSEVPE